MKPGSKYISTYFTYVISSSHARAALFGSSRTPVYDDSHPARRESKNQVIECNLTVDLPFSNVNFLDYFTQDNPILFEWSC